MSNKNNKDGAQSVGNGIRGMDLLRNPAHNKGTAFTKAERDALGLRGLLPPGVLTQQQQAERILRHFRNARSDLDRYVLMNDLMDRSEQLFYKVVMDNLEEMLPILYTPTVGQACQEYGYIFRRPHGVYISARDRGHMPEIFNNWPHKDIRIIVVTDGERILGLGDLGANGMGIPVGKLQLYTACAGVPAKHCLPVMLDVGTENQELLNAPLYLGHKKPRLRGKEYDDMVEEFMVAASEAYPGVLIQFEDFANPNAFPLLKRYRDRFCVFNDDIQGTGSVAMSGILSSLKITGQKLSDQRFLFLGAGAASMGIGDMLTALIMEEGVSKEEARQHSWFMDSTGLIVAGREKLTAHKARYAHPHAEIKDFCEAVKALKPTTIMGASGQPGSFSKEVLRAMAEVNERPIVFALSNPTSKAECTAEEAYRYTDGRAVFASGSPFAPVKYKHKTFIPGQGNNAYIFPGVGLGVVASKSKHVTEEMFFIAAKTVASLVDEDDIAHGRTYPPFDKIGEVSLDIAVEVAKLAWDNGLAQVDRPVDIREFIRDLRYDATYHNHAS
ncbi:MAG: NAD-dependent malic enzyme [Gammaproteobacteria bacterium]|nr:NAD-dependent malic enzyme [Gammaproteobacteria bacterium]